MLLASHFILKSELNSGSYEIFPWIHTYSNTLSADAQTAKVLIPDIPIIRLESEMTMVAGDFNEVYTDPLQLGKWDAIVTCFFIDSIKAKFNQYSLTKYAVIYRDNKRRLKTNRVLD